MIAYLDAADAASVATFSAFADAHRDDYLFGISYDSAATAKVTVPTVVLYKTFDEGRNDLAEPLTAAGLAKFAKDHSVPLLDEISPDNFAMYSEAGLPLAYIFIEATNPERAAITKAIEPVAREHKGKLNFVWIDATKFADHAKSLNLLEPIWPSFAIQNVQSMTKFPLSQTLPVDFATISSFVGDFVKGKIAASVKSQKIPDVQDEPVYILTADGFDAVVAETDKDLFVEFYAPWCGQYVLLPRTRRH